MLSNKNQKYLFERLLKGFSVSYEVIDEARIAPGGAKMREILFRGRCADLNKEWVEGFYTKTFFAGREECIISRKYVKGVYVSGTEYDYESYTVSPETVGQYTGLKDKNGTKIFEGDILKYVDMNECFCEVVQFTNGVFMSASNINRHILGYAYCSCSEIIGNFYDNPELLPELLEVRK